MKNKLKIIPFLIILFYLPNFSYPASVSWHNSQRLGNILILIYSLVLLLFFYQFIIEKFVKTCSVAIFTIAVFSIFLSRNSLWALTELSIIFGLVSIIYVIDNISINFEKLSKKLFFYTLCLTCLVMEVNFLVSYVSSIVNYGPIDFWVLISGFDNPRFFGQFCTIAIPILAIPLCYSFKRKFLYFILFSLFICTAITSGTRGTVLGLAVSLVVIFFTSKKWVEYFLNILGPSVVGLGFHIVLLQWVPRILSQSVINDSVDRINFSLSAREVLWERAIQMILERPMLGYGPMHFASVNSIASHPHQIILQIGSEWGLPVLLLLLILAGFIFNKCLRVLRNNNSSITYTFLFGALIASLAQSMVDGVFVMPYIQYCFFVCAAFLYIEHRLNTNEENFQRNECNTISRYAVKGIAFISIFVLAFSLYPNSMTSYQTSQKKEIKGFLKPRYWLNGQI